MKSKNYHSLSYFFSKVIQLSMDVDLKKMLQYGPINNGGKSAFDKAPYL
ncbi:hypothetical protein [Chryseolinea sp. H1M3-3]|jgi:hypothetical protein|nr:hypothetical protein [Chryseolinea sp. H1M3-3]